MKGLRITAAMTRAMAWLAERGGSGYLDSYGRICCAGIHNSIAPGTWLRLILVGYCERGDLDRIQLTIRGIEALQGSRR